MQSVSELYKESMKNDIRNVNTVQIQVAIENLDFVAKQTIQADNQLFYSTLDHIFEDDVDIPYNYATCELNFIGLDGKKKFRPVDNLEYQGLIFSEISNENGLFVNNPKITITSDITKTYNLYGLQLVFDKNDFGSMAQEIIVRGYNNTVLVEEKHINNITSAAVNISRFEGVNKVEIEIVKTLLPNRRIRIKNIYMGVKKNYTPSNIVKTVETRSIHPLMNEIPETKFSFTIDNINNDFDAENPTGIYVFFMSKQKVVFKYTYELNDGSIEEVKGGVVYLDGKPKAEGIDAEFTAYGIYYYMTDNYIYNNTSSGISYGQLLENIFNASNLPKDINDGVLWRIDASLYNLICKSQIPEKPAKELIQLICNATSMILYEDREGYIHIKPNTSEVYDFKIGLYDESEYPTIEYIDELRNIIVNIYNLEGEVVDTLTLEVNASGEDCEIDNPLISDSTLAQTLAQNTLIYLQKRRKYDIEYMGNVELDVNDIIDVENKFISDTNVRITKHQITYDGAISGVIEGKEY